VLAHHSLHHLVALEPLFENIERSLHSEGRFVVCDMIGRNGHMRWPEVLSWVELLWDALPEKYKFNHLLKRQDDPFVNWDCSTAGFEGIRAQDVLPLLVRYFDFSHFLAYGGVIDVFVDRCYGPNFIPDDPTDTRFIDFVQRLNELLLRALQIKPTMVIGIARKKGSSDGCAYWENLSPETSIRRVDG
jgi:hypothetical protein